MGHLSALNYYISSTSPKEERNRGEFSLFLPEPLKKRGISKAFVTYFVNQHNIREVRSTLAQDNFAAFMRAKDKGLTDEEAYAGTPSGRIFLSLNFRVIEAKFDDDLLQVDYIIRK